MTNLRRLDPHAASGGPTQASDARAQLIQACQTGDRLGIRRLGWWDVYDTYATMWESRHEVSAKDFTRYAKALGDQNPDDVVAAFRALAGTWRPSPAAVLGEIQRPRDNDASGVDVGRGRHRIDSAAACANRARRPPRRRGDLRMPRLPDGAQVATRRHGCHALLQVRIA